MWIFPIHDPQSLDTKNYLSDDFIQNMLKKDIPTWEQTFKSSYSWLAK
jgi:hypothetical protein